MTDGVVADPRRMDRRSGNLMCLASMVIWAAGFPAAELLLDSWDPLALIAARLCLALALLLPLWLLLDGLDRVRRARWRRGTLVGGLGFGLGAYLLIWAQAQTDPVTVAVIAAASPVAGTVIEMLRGERRLTAGFVAGLAAAVIGGIIAIGGSILSVQVGLGAVAAVASCCLYAWASDLAVRDFPDLSPIGRTALTLAGGTLFALGLFMVTLVAGGVSLPSAPPDAATWQALIIYAVAAMGISQLLFIAGVGRLGVAVATFHVNLAPFYVMLILLALGAPWQWPQAIGAAVVLAGVILAQR